MSILMMQNHLIEYLRQENRIYQIMGRRIAITFSIIGFILSVIQLVDLLMSSKRIERLSYMGIEDMPIKSHYENMILVVSFYTVLLLIILIAQVSGKKKSGAPPQE